MPPLNPADALSITNTLSLYCVALDTKSLALLSQVFTSDVTATYPFHASAFHGVDAVREAITARLGPIRTHHSLTTQRITFPSPGTANAESHFIGAHLGQGPHAGKVLTAYGRYMDELICVPFADAAAAEAEGVPGASGKWMIRKRTVTFVGRVGDEAIMREY